MRSRSFQNKSFSSLTTHHGFLVVDIKFPLWFTWVMSTFLIPVMWFNLQPVRNWPGVSPTCSHQSSSQTHQIDGPVPSAAVCYSVSDTNVKPVPLCRRLALDCTQVLMIWCQTCYPDLTWASGDLTERWPHLHTADSRLLGWKHLACCFILHCAICVDYDY